MYVVAQILLGVFFYKNKNFV